MTSWHDVFNQDSTVPDVSAMERMVGSRHKSKGKHGDFYPTPPIATQELLVREAFIGSIREPACGNGAMSDVLIAAGYSVISTDKYDRGYGTPGIDYLKTSLPAENTVTNPPFKYANQFIHKALLQTDRKVALLLRINYLASRTRKKFFKNTAKGIDFPFKIVYIFTYRIPFEGGDNMMDFAWFVWDKSYTGQPQIDWI